MPSQTSLPDSWNAGEDFPSLGIGHFIWYRAGQQEIFEESFPQLLSFLKRQQVALPHGCRIRLTLTTLAQSRCV